MKGSILKRRLGLMAVAIGLIAAATVAPAMSYFTTYATAKGGYTLNLGESTSMKETFAEWTKHITIANTGETECYVRVKAFSGSQYPLYFSSESSLWSLHKDGYWYYNAILPAGTVMPESEALAIEIHRMDEASVQDFNVIVIEEAAPVLYDENGVPSADWDKPLINETNSYDVAKGAQ